MLEDFFQSKVCVVIIITFNDKILEFSTSFIFFPLNGVAELCTLENLVMLDLSGNFFIGMQGKYKVKFWLYIYHVRT